MKKLFLISTLIVATTILTSFLPSEKSLNEIKKEDPVSDILKKLGDAPILHQAKMFKGASAEIGKDLALYGIAKKQKEAVLKNKASISFVLLVIIRLKKIQTFGFLILKQD